MYFCLFQDTYASKEDEYLKLESTSKETKDGVDTESEGSTLKEPKDGVDAQQEGKGKNLVWN